MKLLRALAWVGVFVLLSAARSQAADDAFAKWWPRFQAAVARHDAKAVGQGMRFPQPWENGPKIREIKSQQDLAEHFDRFFSAEIKRQIAHAAPERLPNGNYLFVWHARGNEYSLNFTRSGDAFVLDGLGEGPP
jgi:hypothetical protein